MTPPRYDPEIAAALAALSGAGPAPRPLARGDWAALRRRGEAGLAARGATVPVPPDVTTRSFATVAPDGAEVELRWYAKHGSAPGSAVVYLHGGGMIMGSLDLHDPYARQYVDATGVPMLAAGYRLAPEHPHPAPVEDCYAALAWMAGHAAGLGVDAARIGILGESAGGGLAAAVALLARDRGTPLARQILVYPMLDDRTVPDAGLATVATWSYDDNWTGWSALLAGEPGVPGVPASAAPARASDLRGVAPADIEVGALDIFRDESVDYARRLTAAGVAVELHVFRGAPHGYDVIAPEAATTRLALALRHRAIRSL